MSILDMSLDPSTCKTIQIRKTKFQELDECVSSQFVSFSSPLLQMAETVKLNLFKKSEKAATAEKKKYYFCWFQRKELRLFTYVGFTLKCYLH